MSESKAVEPKYLNGQGVTPDAVGRLFRAAAMFHRRAPWKKISDADAFRVDVPALVARDHVLARVVDHEGVSIVCGMYGRALGPADARAVVDRARKKLRKASEVPVERLRKAAIDPFLIGAWQDAVADLDVKALVPPKLQNTEGDDFLPTTDHFVVTGDLAAVQSRLAEVPMTTVDHEEGVIEITFHRKGNPMHASWDNTIVGHAKLTSKLLRAETNSVRRADSLRRTIEAACGDLVRHRAREHTDPMSAPARAAEKSKPRRREEAPPPEMLAALLDFKSKHYETWVDQPVPALSNRGPKQAMRTKAGRAKVDLLLCEYKHHEARLPEAERFDFTKLRAALGLE